ncbi:Fc.00g088930.m01.CDS01 [Cosmosporella sp. VM-42]
MNPHANLIQALTEFYSVFVQLAYVEPSFLTFPNSSIAAEYFNAAAALEAGFLPEVVELVPQLPFLHVDNREGALEIMPSTDPVTYLGKDFNGEIFRAGEFENLRLLDLEGMEDVYIPSHSFRLSRQNIYGVTLIYNTETRRMTEWVSFENDDDEYGYDQVPAKLPTEVLGPWTERYRKIEILSWPEGDGWIKGVDFYPDMYYTSDDWSDQDRIDFRAEVDLKKARSRLRDFYIQCGWDVKSKIQESFDRQRFVEMRESYFKEVILPLEERWYGGMNG